MKLKKKFFISGGRSTSTLDLARQLHAAGHHIITADTTSLNVCAFSRAVAKSVVFPSPRFKTAAFSKTIIEIVSREKVDYVIPTYEEALYFSKFLDQFPKECHVFTDSFETLHHLHNKWLFYQKQLSYGIEAPRTVLVKNAETAKNFSFAGPYALKECYSRASQSVCRIEKGAAFPGFSIDPRNPWIAQEWLEGDRFCTYSICHDGIVKAHAVYPVQFAIKGRSCLNFVAVEHPGIFDWVCRFAALTKYTGQVGFDFFELPNGKLYAIECNPRSTNGLLLFSPKDRIDRAFTNETPYPIFPKIGYRKQIAIGMCLYGTKDAFKSKKIKGFLKTFLTSPDVVFSWNDPKPLLAMPFIFLFYIFQKMKLKLSLPSFFTFDCNWDGD